MDYGLSLSPGEQSKSLKIVLPTWSGKRGSEAASRPSLQMPCLSYILKRF